MTVTKPTFTTFDILNTTTIRNFTVIRQSVSWMIRGQRHDQRKGRSRMRRSFSFFVEKA